jgi:superfamily I DNA and/or RNA helicase
MSKFNEGEAKIALNHYNHLIENGIDPCRIAIISPYSAQVTLIRELLFESQQQQQPEVNSIDAFQGREKDVIILSLVRSNGEGVVGFLGEMRRINVAMTRAKKQLVVIGDSETLSRDEELKDLVRFVSVTYSNVYLYV